MIGLYSSKMLLLFRNDLNLLLRKFSLTKHIFYSFVLLNCLLLTMYFFNAIEIKIISIREHDIPPSADFRPVQRGPAEVLYLYHSLYHKTATN